MLNRILSWFKGNTVEKNLVKEFNKNPQVYIEPMISYYKTCERFKGFDLNYHSPSYMVSVCMDIYGPEVKIQGHDKLLDCCPEEYGLTDEQGKRLYEAILSCVPGTIFFKERVIASINVNVDKVK